MSVAIDLGNPETDINELRDYIHTAYPDDVRRASGRLLDIAFNPDTTVEGADEDVHALLHTLKSAEFIDPDDYPTDEEVIADLSGVTHSVPDDKHHLFEALRTIIAYVYGTGDITHVDAAHAQSKFYPDDVNGHLTLHLVA